MKAVKNEEKKGSTAKRHFKKSYFIDNLFNWFENYVACFMNKVIRTIRIEMYSIMFEL